MTSGKKYTYRKHEGDLSASEITMADDERIELMLMVKEGKISMHDAVERVKAYERQHRCFDKSSPEKEGERKHSPQLSSLLRRKSSDSRGSGDGRSQESPRSKRSSSSTESSPGHRSRSGSRSRSRSGTQTLVDFCPEEQLIVELSHPEGSTGVTPGGATNISISVKPLCWPDARSSTASSTSTLQQTHKSRREEVCPLELSNNQQQQQQHQQQQQPQQQQQSVLCSGPICWMSPKRSRKYISSSPENTLPRDTDSKPPHGPLPDPPTAGVVGTGSDSGKSKKASPGGETKRSFLKSPFSRRKRSGSSTTSPTSAKEKSSPPSVKTDPPDRPPDLPEPRPSRGQVGVAAVSAAPTPRNPQQPARTGAAKAASHPNSIEVTPRQPESTYQHSNLLYRKGSTSSSSSSSIQSPRDPRLLDAARFAVKREKTSSPSSSSPGAASTQPTSTTTAGAGVSATQQKPDGRANGKSPAPTNGASGVVGGSKAGGAGSRIPSYYSNPCRRKSTNLSDGPDGFSDSSSEGGRTRRSRAYSDARKTNGAARGGPNGRSCPENRSSSTESLKKQSKGQVGGTLPGRKGKQPPQLTIPGSTDSQPSSDNESTRTLTRSQAAISRSSSGSRLPVNVRSSLDSPPRSPRSPVSPSPRSPRPAPSGTSDTSVSGRRYSGGRSSPRGSVSSSDESRRPHGSSTSTLPRSVGTRGSSRATTSRTTPSKTSSNETKGGGEKRRSGGSGGSRGRQREDQKRPDQKDSVSLLSVGSDTSTTSVESRRLKEPSDKSRIPRSTSGSTTNDECLTSDYDDSDMADKNPDMFVRNSANRNSLSERMKGLGRDVKKKISRLKPNRVSRDAEEILAGGDEDGAADKNRHSTIGIQGGSSGGDDSLWKEEEDATYKGNFVGRAKVIRDYTPSPYDREALTLKQGDVINIISMNETGMWRGMVGSRVGTFKFINVEMLAPSTGGGGGAGGGAASGGAGAANSPLPSPVRRPPRQRGPRRPRPRTVHELLLRLGLQHLTTVFLLHGYHTLELFSELEEEDLDELCITQSEERAKILTAAQLLVDYENTESPESGTGSRPNTPAGPSLTPAGSTQTLTEQTAASSDNLTAAPQATSSEEPHQVTEASSELPSTLRQRELPESSSSHHFRLRGMLDARDSGCYASSETLQPAPAEVPPPAPASETSSAPPTDPPQPVAAEAAAECAEEGEDESEGSEAKTAEKDGGEEAVNGETPRSNGPVVAEVREEYRDAPTPREILNMVAQANERGQPELIYSVTPCVQIITLPDSLPEENGDMGSFGGSSSRLSTPATSPRSRVRPRPPMRRPTGSSTSSFTAGAGEDSDGGGSGELSPLRRSRPGGVAHRLSSQSSQASTSSPCGSPPPLLTMSPPLGSPHQIRSQSLPGSPLRSHSPSMVVNLPARPHSPVLHRTPLSHRYSTPSIQSLKQRLRPKVPERTSSLPLGQSLSGSSESITSSTQTPQSLYAESGVHPTVAPASGRFGGGSVHQFIQNGHHTHLRRASTPALRTYMSFTPPGSPQKSKLPSSFFPASSTPGGSTGAISSRVVVRNDNIAARRRTKAVSVTLEALVVAKLEEEGIDLTQPPYTDPSGFCGIPPALVQRYAEELRREVAEIATALDECRSRHLQNNGRIAVPNDFLVDSCNTPSFDVATSSVPDFLVSIGMPMYMEQLVEQGRQTVESIKDLRESDWKKVGVTDPRHLRRLAQGTELLRARLIHADKQKLLRIAKLSQIRDKV